MATDTDRHFGDSMDIFISAVKYSRELTQCVPKRSSLWVPSDSRHIWAPNSCYSKFMLSGVFHRTAMAILLMGSLVASYGICPLSSQKTEHSCCSHASESGKSMPMKCCTVSTPLQAIIVAPELPNTTPMLAVDRILATYQTAHSSDFANAEIILPLSPPTGAFNLRI